MNNRFLALFLALALIVSGFSSVPVVLAQAVTVAITAPAAGATLVVGQPTVTKGPHITVRTGTTRA